MRTSTLILWNMMLCWEGRAFEVMNTVALAAPRRLRALDTPHMLACPTPQIPI